MELDRELPSPSSSASLSPTSSSLKQKLRSSICFSCCFIVHGGSGEDGGGGGDDCEDRPITIARLLPEIGERWRDVVARIGSSRRRLAGEFRYDPLSYSLNFDEGAAADDDDDGPLSGDGFQFRNFSSRLPPSPPLTAAAPAIA